jgi:hypothetical protein
MRLISLLSAHRSRLRKIILSILLLFIFSSFIKAHHESLPAPEREYLKLISLHPFKDKVISQDNHDFFITVAETAPDTFTIFFYIENSLFKRAVHSPKEILFYNEDAKLPDKFNLESDISGVSSMQYFAHKPFEAKIKVSAVTNDNKPISVETDIQIGSPQPSIVFIIIFGLTILIMIIIVSRQLSIRKTKMSETGNPSGSKTQEN